MRAIATAARAYSASLSDADPRRRSLLSAEDFESFAARDQRYEMNWGYYQNNFLQESVHPILAATYKRENGLYKYSRHVYNPAYRMVEFWASRVWGGSLDREAGDGEAMKSALPIEADNDTVRKAIAKLWEDSCWQVNKDQVPRFGAALGDVAIRVRVNAIKEKVRLKVEHPNAYQWVERNADGEVTAYLFHERRYDPRLNANADLSLRQMVDYTEEATLRDGKVRYKTYLGKELYPWDGVASDWVSDYPFIPVVFIQHESVGMEWGLCCFHAGYSKIREVDDQAAILSDQVRKLLMAPKVLAGAKGPQDITADTSRDSMALLYISKPDVSSISLIDNMPIADVIAHIASINADLEKNYPELMSDVSTSAGDASGRALRVARQSTSAKVQSHRPAYDDGLVRAHRMAIAIGGGEGFPGYEGYGFDSYEDDSTAHRIGHRNVFEADPLDELEEEAAFLNNAKLADEMGISPDIYFAWNGYPADKIAQIKKSLADAEAKQQAQFDREMQAKQATAIESEGPQSNPARPGEPDRSAPPALENKQA